MISFPRNLKSAPNCPTDVHVVLKSLETEQNESTSDGENERLTLKKMVDELQKLLDTRKGTIESLENEKDILEKERMLKEIEIKVWLIEIKRGSLRDDG